MSEEQTTITGLFRPEVLADPYPAYRKLRAEVPVFWDGWSWLVTRYVDVRPALLDPRLLAARITPSEAWLAETGLGPLFRAHTNMMLWRSRRHRPATPYGLPRAATARPVTATRSPRWCRQG